MIYLYIFLCLIASAFFSGMEIAFLSSDKLRLELDRSRGGVSARILGVFYSRPDHFITTMLLGNNVALVIYGLLTAVLMEPWLKSLLGENDGLILLAQSVLSTLLILFVGEFLPNPLSRLSPALSLCLDHRADHACDSFPCWAAYLECGYSPPALFTGPRVLPHA